VAVYEAAVSSDTRYDLLDRSFEFKVIGNSRHTAFDMVHHPSAWQGDVTMSDAQCIRHTPCADVKRHTECAGYIKLPAPAPVIYQEPVHTKLKLLVLYDERSTHINTVRDHLESFVKFSANDVYYAVATHDAPCEFDLAAFDVVIVHYSVRVCLGTHISVHYKKRLQEFTGLKVLFIQDEYECTEVSRQFIESYGIRLVFTALDSVAVEKVYPRKRFPGVQFVENLTGYVPESLESLPQVRPLAERKVMIGYRGRKLGYWYGNLGQEKLNIGRRMRAICEERGIVHDIAWGNSDRIYGPAWNDFLQSIRATLGTPSGSNVFDYTGTIRKSIEKGLAANPELTYDEAFRLYLSEHEGKVVLDVISPKVFEAAACRTALILYPGGYSGVVQPNEHYIPLERDFSNIDDVLAKVADDAFITALTDRAYEHVIASRKYNYRAFAAMVDEVLATYVRGTNDVALRTSVTSVCKPGTDSPVFAGPRDLFHLPSKTVYANRDCTAAKAAVPPPLVMMLPQPGLARRMGRRLPEFVKRPIRRMLSL
jgi:hypothetical protein